MLLNEGEFLTGSTAKCNYPGRPVGYLALFTAAFFNGIILEVEKRS